MEQLIERELTIQSVVEVPVPALASFKGSPAGLQNDVFVRQGSVAIQPFDNAASLP